MACQVILAVAGAGKTHYICNNLDENKRVLILTFTKQNISNIHQELLNIYKTIPSHIKAQTFDSFVYNEFIRPYEPSIAQQFEVKSFSGKGVSLKDPPTIKKTIKGKEVANRDYKIDNLRHYVDDRGLYYCKTLSKLVLQVKSKNKKEIPHLVDRAINRLALFYDSIYVDEFQDFRLDDFKLLMRLAKRFPCTVFVGDYFQHSAIASKNTGFPFKGRDYNSFINLLKDERFNVDTNTLQKSRRCPQDVCNFVKDKFHIPISSSGINNGRVIWADTIADQVLQDNSITKLVFSNSSKYAFPCLNWSYSKGSTFQDVCVILTKDFENLDDEKFNLTNQKQITINKLYVALTRTSRDLYLIKFSTFKSISQNYIF